MKSNVRIYALLFSLMVSIKLTIQGLIFDNYLNQVIINDFIHLRFLAITISILSLAALVPLFNTELQEIVSNVRNQRVIQGQIDAMKESMLKHKEDHRRHKKRSTVAHKKKNNARLL